MSLHCIQVFHYKTIKRQSDQEKKMPLSLLGKSCLYWFSQLFFFFLNQLCCILIYQSHCDMSKTTVVFCALTYVIKHHTNEKAKLGIKMKLLQLKCHKFPIMFLWGNFNQSPYNAILFFHNFSHWTFLLTKIVHSFLFLGHITSCFHYIKLLCC